MKALYPMVGGTATSHKFNLKDPRDVDAAFRLVFNGGWTHTATGALPNGTNAWANTYFSEYSHITNSDTQLSNFSHASIYSRTNSPSINLYGGIGVDNSQDGYGYFAINPKRADGLSYGVARGTLFTTPVNMPDSRGLFLINRQSNSLLKYSRDNSLLSQNTTLNTRGASRIAFYLGATNNWGSAAYFDNKEHSLVSLGYSLTDTEATNFYNSVQKYQTSLGRQVGTPVLAEGQTAGLLETYSGAAAAYSLRKLRNGYVGNAIRVRRSSDNSEQDIAFKSDGTLDTVSLLAFVGSGNGFVTTWYDQSGYNNHIIQTTAANQPSIVLSGVLNTQNSKPVILTDGSSFMVNSSLSWDLTTNSIFATIKLTATRGIMAMLSSVGTSNQHFVSRAVNGTNRYYDSGSQDITATALPNGFNLISIHENTSGVTVFENGANLVTNFAHDTGGTVNGIVIFKRDAGNGLTSGSGFSELIVYGNTSKLTNNTAIESNINTYYSIY